MSNRQKHLNYAGRQPKVSSVMKQTLKIPVKSCNPENRGKVGDKKVEKITAKTRAMVNKPHNNNTSKNLEFSKEQLIHDGPNIQEAKLNMENYEKLLFEHHERNFSLANSLKREISEWREKKRLEDIRTQQQFADFISPEPIFGKFLVKFFVSTSMWISCVALPAIFF